MDDFAIKKKNINLCDNSLGFFVGGRPKEQSIYLCKAAYAVGVGNLEYCRNLDKEAPYVNCRQQFATKYHQPEICDEIKVEVGNIYDEYKKDFCYLDIAALSKDPRLCDKVSDESNRGSCYGELANIAINDGDVELCGVIKDEDLRDYCYRDVVLETK